MAKQSVRGLFICVVLKSVGFRYNTHTSTHRNTPGTIVQSFVQIIVNHSLHAPSGPLGRCSLGNCESGGGLRKNKGEGVGRDNTSQCLTAE